MEDLKKYSIIALILIISTVLVAGCTAAEQKSGTLYGKDLFDPTKFTYALYDITISHNGEDSRSSLLVYAGKDNSGGYRITTVQLYDDGSVRTDASG